MATIVAVGVVLLAFFAALEIFRVSQFHYDTENNLRCSPSWSTYRLLQVCCNKASAPQGFLRGIGEVSGDQGETNIQRDCLWSTFLKYISRGSLTVIVPRLKRFDSQAVYPLIRAHRILDAQNIPTPVRQSSGRSRKDTSKRTKRKQPSLFDPALHRVGLLPARKYGDVIRIPIGPWNVSSQPPKLQWPVHMLSER